MPRRTKAEDEEPDDYIDEDAVRTVIVFRGANNRPVVVPQDVAEESDVIYRAHMAKLSGKSWKQVAEDLGFPNAIAAKAAVSRYLDEARSLIATETAKEMLVQEVELLDYMQTKLWSMVELGDPKAIDQVLKIATKRVEWQNLAVKDDAADQDLRTVVIPGEAYVQYLKELSDSSAPGDDPQIVESKAVPSISSTSHQEEDS